MWFKGQHATDWWGLDQLLGDWWGPLGEDSQDGRCTKQWIGVYMWASVCYCGSKRIFFFLFLLPCLCISCCQTGPLLLFIFLFSLWLPLSDLETVVCIKEKSKELTGLFWLAVFIPPPFLLGPPNVSSSSSRPTTSTSSMSEEEALMPLWWSSSSSFWRSPM